MVCVGEVVVYLEVYNYNVFIICPFGGLRHVTFVWAVVETDQYHASTSSNLYPLCYINYGLLCLCYLYGRI